jgi:hypothetical protein
MDRECAQRRMLLMSRKAFIPQNLSLTNKERVGLNAYLRIGKAENGTSRPNEGADGAGSGVSCPQAAFAVPEFIFKNLKLNGFTANMLPIRDRFASKLRRFFAAHPTYSGTRAAAASLARPGANPALARPGLSRSSFHPVGASKFFRSARDLWRHSAVMRRSSNSTKCLAPLHCRGPSSPLLLCSPIAASDEPVTPSTFPYAEQSHPNSPPILT